VSKRKLARLKQILGRRERWREKIEQIKRMKQWVLDIEHILDGSWAEIPDKDPQSPQSTKKVILTNKEVGIRFDQVLQNLEQKLTEDGMSQTERECLKEFLRTFYNLRPYLIQCYDLAVFPRTNNEMEGSIRKIKTRYRRISGRKNWSTYLLRHGRNAAFYDWWEAKPERWQKFEILARKMDREHWKEMKKEALVSQSEQLKRFRFRHKREAFLTTLEERWAASCETDTLH
jgi:hypothetical protein